MGCPTRVQTILNLFVEWLPPHDLRCGSKVGFKVCAQAFGKDEVHIGASQRKTSVLAWSVAPTD